MGFNFEGHVVFVVELHDAGVVFKDAHAPVVRTKVFSNLNSCRKDGFFEHVVEFNRTVFVAVLDATGQRLVAAVFGPGLSNRL